MSASTSIRHNSASVLRFVTFLLLRCPVQQASGGLRGLQLLEWGRRHWDLDGSRVALVLLDHAKLSRSLSSFQLREVQLLMLVDSDVVVCFEPDAAGCVLDDG